MDPNVSTQMPAGYTNTPLGLAEDLTIKFYVFGTLAIVISCAIAFGAYLVFYKKDHVAKKEARYEQQALDLEKGILPKSRHYGIGKVPKTRVKKMSLAREQERGPAFSNPFEESPGYSSSSSEVTVALTPPPKALTSQKVREAR